MKRFAVYNDGNENEALYIDGRMVSMDKPMLAQEIAERASGHSIKITHAFVEMPDGADWPARESGLKDWIDGDVTGDVCVDLCDCGAPANKSGYCDDCFGG